MHSATIVGEGKPGTEYEESSALMFAGRVFIFTLNPLTFIQIGELSKWYQEKSLHLKILGADYWTAHWQNPVQTQR
jgi:hypothetical protein